MSLRNPFFRKGWGRTWCLCFVGWWSTAVVAQDASSTLLGSATALESCVQLTPPGGGTGACWMPVDHALQSGFHWTGAVGLGANDTGGEGMVFVLQAAGSGALGADGSGLGYAGIGSSFGVAIDTYGTTGDVVSWVVNGGLSPMGSSVSIGNAEDGELHQMSITWRPEDSMLVLNWDGSTILEQFVSPDVFPTGSEVWWGWTASGAGASNEHRVCGGVLQSMSLEAPTSVGVACVGDSVVLTAAHLGVVWEDGSTADTLVVTEAGAYRYMWIHPITGESLVSEPWIGFHPVASGTLVASPEVVGLAGGGVSFFPANSVQYTASWSNGSTTPDLYGLDAGIYTLTTTTDMGCVWSGTVEVPAWEVNQEGGLVVEAFWDSDPGVGLGELLEWDSMTGLAAVDISGLSPGLHRLGVRVQDGFGRWSCASWTHFFAPMPQVEPRELVRAEAFIDVDPGPGMGTALVGVEQGLQWSNGAFEWATAQDLSPGMHKVFVRVQDELGFWSTPVSQAFQVLEGFNPAVSVESPIAAAECFLAGTDPGVGNGHPLALVPGDTTQAFGGFSTAGLEPGTYHLMVRVKDFSGKWSMASSVEFTIEAAECPDLNPLFTWEYDGNSVALEGSDPEGYEHFWDFGSDGTVEATGSQSTLEWPSALPYLVAHTVSSGDGCEASHIALLDFGTPVFTEVNVLGNLWLCSGDTTWLEAPAGTDYVWNTGATGGLLAVTQPGIYQCSYVNAAGHAAVTASVSVFDDSIALPEVSVFPSDGANGAIQLEFPLPAQEVLIAWSHGPGAGLLTGLNSGVYTCSLSTEHCSESLEVEVPFVAATENGLLVECWWDDDPGPGNGVLLDLAQINPLTGITGLDVSQLTPGIHRLGVRAYAPESGWSHAQYVYYVHPYPTPLPDPVVQAEVFFDVDPGPGMGFSVPIGDSGVVDVEVPVEGLLPGWHHAYVRVKSASGRWSVPERSAFSIVVPSTPPVQQLDAIVAAEYFIGPDPGAGNGVPLTLEPASPAVAWKDVSVAGLGIGTHSLSVRSRSLLTGWSFAQTFDLEIFAPTCAMPVVDFITAVNGQEVQFASTSTNLQDDCTFAWDFDMDGSPDAFSADTLFSFDDTSSPVVVTLTVDNGNGCSASAQHVLFSTADQTELPLLVTGNLELCAGDSVVLVAPAGGVDYVWNTGATGDTLVVSEAGWFQCNFLTASGHIAFTEGLNTTYSPLPPFGIGTGLGSAQVVFPNTVNAAGLEFVWSNGIEASFISNVEPGAYSVTVSNGVCSSTLDVFIEDASGLQTLGLEYFFDTDPGPGAGISLPNVPADGGWTVGMLDWDSLAPGPHLLGVRARSEAGWGLATFITVFIPHPVAGISDLVAAEYFYGDDPGVGAGTPLTVVPGSAVSLEEIELEGPTSAIGGRVLLSVRFKAENGRWSTTNSTELFVCEAPDAPVVAEDFVTVCSNIPVAFGVAAIEDVVHVWTRPDGSVAEGDSLFEAIPQEGIYGVQARAVDGCLSYPATIEVTLEAPPSFTSGISGLTSICPELGAAAYSIVGGSDWDYGWSSSFGTWVEEGAFAELFVPNDSQGVLSIQVTASNDCGSASSSVLIAQVVCIEGCMDGLACNFNASAVFDDGSCIFPPDGGDCEGCYVDMDSDGVCDEVDPCVGAYSACGVCNGPELDSDGDGIPNCLEVPGCTDPSACNFEVGATDNNGSCCFGGCFAFQPLSTTFSSAVQFILPTGEVVETLTGYGSLGNTTCLASSCLGVRLLNPNGVGVSWTLHLGDTLFSGALQGVEVDVLQWTPGCEGAPGDAQVNGVEGDADSYSPGDQATVSFTASNIGYSPLGLGWVERIFATNEEGGLEVELGTWPSADVQPGESEVRSRVVELPDPWVLGGFGRFGVELIAPVGALEYLANTANNRSVENEAWTVARTLSWSVSDPTILEGASQSIQLHRSGSISQPLTVVLASEPNSELLHPSTVYFPANTLTRTVTFTAVEDDLLQGNTSAVVTASAAGWASDEVTWSLIENESPQLAIALASPEVVEGETVDFVVTTNLASAQDLEVYLNYTSPQQLSGPLALIIPAGQTEASGTIVAVNNSIPESELTLSVHAGAAGHIGATSALSLVDDDIPDLVLAFSADTVSEGVGSFAVLATISRSAAFGDLTVTVTLEADLPNQIFHPTTVQLLPGELSNTFNVGVINTSLNEGTRAVVLGASVVFSNCGCAAEPGGYGYASDTLVILDNDGMALGLSVTPSVMPEGVSGGMLVLSHNSVLPAPVSVALHASPAGEVDLPASVELPAGTGAINVPFSTLFDGIEDGTRQVYITASAPGFNAGQSILFVTDQNKPNLEILSASLSADTLTPGDHVVFTAEIENTGFVTMPSGWSWTIESESGEWHSGTFNAPTPVGGTATLVASIPVPVSPGVTDLELVVNEAGFPSEINYVTNTFALGTVLVQSPFVATVAVSEPFLPGGSSVPFTGNLIGSNSNAIASTAVEVYVLNGPYRREIQVTTNSLGQFSGAFTPYATEQGTYTIGASYPGMSATAVQDTFDLLGLDREAPSQIIWNGITGESLSDSIRVHNPTSVDFTGLVVTASNAWSGAQPAFSAPQTIAAGASVWIPYTVNFTEATPGANYYNFDLAFSADQGAIEAMSAYAKVQDPFAVLASDPTSLVVSVSDQIGFKVVEFDVTNIGGGASGPIALALPSGDWIGSLVGNQLPPLDPGETTTVSLLFTASNSVPLQYTVNGNLALQPENGNFLLLPFQFTRVSEANASLSVLATNQFTYFGETQPALAGAHVRVETFYGNTLLAEGVTDSTGWFEVDDIPEGPVRIVVEKEQHAAAVLEVNLNAGLANIYTAFLDFQPVTYWWDVQEVEIEDSYTITLNATFVTHVPMPVLRIELPEQLPALVGDEVYVFNATLINEGLIAFDEVQLVLPEDAEYEFLTDFVPASLPALSAVEVPVIMRRIDAWSVAGMAMGDNEGVASVMAAHALSTQPASSQFDLGLACRLFFAALGAYECAFGQTLLGQALDEVGIDERDCPSSIPPPPPYVDEYENNPFFGGGCVGCGFPGFVIDFPDLGIELCDDCFQELASGAVNCGGAALNPANVSAVRSCGESIGGAIFECILKEEIENLLNGLGASPVAGMPPASFAMIPPVGGEHYTHLVQQLSEVYGPEIASEFAQTYMAVDLLGAGAADTALIQAFVGANAGDLGDVIVASSPDLGATAVEDEEIDLGIYAPYHALLVDYTIHMFGIAAEEVLLELVYGELADYEAFGDFYTAVHNRVLDQASFTQAEEDSLVGVFEAYDWGEIDLSTWFTDWNAHVAELGADNPDFAWEVFNRQLTLLQAADYFSVTRGFEDFEDFFFTSQEAVQTLIETGDGGGDESGACASVQMEIVQEFTMTREAFEGTFGIANGHADGALQFLDVNVQVFDPDGIPRNDLFQIELIETDISGAVDGNGTVPTGGQGTAVFLFIPEREAAPTEPVQYGFGGTVSYYDPSIAGMVTQALEPVYLTVEPSPDLYLDYYLDRTVYGDDPLTEAIEPSLPAELSLMIHNAGYGQANNVLLASSQPSIVSNDLGLAVNFEIIGSQFEGEPANLGVLNVEFGAIPSFESRIGSWFLTSNLLGYFTGLSAEVVHNNSFGNPELSLIESVEFHERIRTIRNPLPGDDGRDDFLVNSFYDPFAYPDEVHFSQGDSIAEVLPPTSLDASALDLSTSLSTVSLVPAEPGWTYFRIPSPGGAYHALVQVVRSDGSVVPAQNAWISQITVPMTGDPIHEPVLHLFDWVSGEETYTLFWDADFETPLTILEIEGVANGVEAEILFAPLDSLVVQFDRPIEVASFTAEDLELWSQSEPVSTENITIYRLDEDSTRFALDLASVNQGDGLYQLTVHTYGIQDFTGNPGQNGEQRAWVQWVGRPYVMSAIDAFDVFRSVEEPIYIGETMPHFDLIFNTAMEDSTVVSSAFSLIRGDTVIHEYDPFAIDLDARLQRLDSLDMLLDTDGSYTLEVDLTALQAESGLYGWAPQSIEFIRDRVAPQLIAIEPSASGGFDSQHVTSIDLIFSEPVTGLDALGFQLLRNTIDTIDFALGPIGEGTVWRIEGFGLGTYPEGDYELSLSQLTGIQDLTGLNMALDTSFDWTVNRFSDFQVLAAGISPDWGYSSSDAISFGTHFDVVFSLNEFASSVAVEQFQGGNWLELTTLYNVGAGESSASVVSLTEGSSMLRIRATNLSGVEHVAIQNIFLDPVNLNGAWTVLSTAYAGGLEELALTFTAPVMDGVNFLNKLSLTRNGIPVPLGAIVLAEPDSMHLHVSQLSTAHTEPGEYTLSFSMLGVPKRITGRSGTATPAYTWVVESPNTPPVADAGQDAVLNALGSAILDGTNSNDPDGDVLLYTWYSSSFNFPQGTTGSSTVVTPVPGLPPGEYSVVLMVSDGELTDIDVVNVIVQGVCSSDVDGDGVCDEDEIYGCTDNTASNFMENATEDDGSCISVEPCVADIDSNGVITTGDLLLLLADFGDSCSEGEGCIADLDQNGGVGITDLLILLPAFGTSCD